MTLTNYAAKIPLKTFLSRQLLKTFFVSQTLTNAASLPLNSSISSNHVFIAVCDFGTRKSEKFTLECLFFYDKFVSSCMTILHQWPSDLTTSTKLDISSSFPEAYPHNPNSSSLLYKILQELYVNCKNQLSNDCLKYA